MSIYPYALTMKSGVERSVFEREPPRAWDRKNAADKARFSFDGLAATVVAGNYKGSFRIERAGVYVLHASHKNPFMPLPGSPMSLTVVAGRSHAKSSPLPPEIVA